jgi:hypothetical protein
MANVSNGAKPKRPAIRDTGGRDLTASRSPAGQPRVERTRGRRLLQKETEQEPPPHFRAGGRLGGRRSLSGTPGPPVRILSQVLVLAEEA